MQAERDERVLQRPALACVRVYVAARHALEPKPPRQPGQPPVASAVTGQVGTLQLDAQARGPECLAQPPQRRLVVDAARVAAAQTDEALGTVEDVLDGDQRLPGSAPAGARVQMRPCEQPAEVRPAGRVADQQGHVPAVVEVELGAVERAQAERPGALGELHRAGDRVVVGQGEGAVPQLQGGSDQLVGQRGTVQKREGRVAVQLLVTLLQRADHELLGQRGAVQERVGRMGVQLCVGRHERMFA